MVKKCLIGLAAGALISASVPAAFAAGTAGPSTVYVDCSHGNDSASGTSPRTAWSTLAKVDAQTFAPGTVIRFRRGTTCTGTLTLTSSYVTVTAYGTGAKPRVDGAGATDAIVISNADHIELHDLDVTNTGTTASERRGIWLRLTDYGTGHHYVIQGVDVHDVNGEDDKSTTGSAGILFSSLGSTTPTSFDDVQILDDTVTHVDRSGINFGSTWNQRPEHGDTTTTWTPNTRVRISGNTVTNTGGDGIVVQDSKAAVVEYNHVSYFQMRSTGYNAGLWAWNSDGTLFQYNEVDHGQTTRDGMAFDIDGAQRDTVFQYNYSHDNVGGFLLLCNGTGMVNDNGTVRYNVSRNDSNYLITIGCSAATDQHVYNNTIITDKKVDAIWNPHNLTDVGTFQNNIFDVAPGSTLTDTLDPLRNNLYWGIAAPSLDSSALTGDPLFVNPGSPSPEGLQLRPGSPALGSGATIPDNGGQDFHRHPVPDDTAPDIGAFQK